MNGAPAVRFVVKRSVFYAWLLLGMWALAVACNVYWFFFSVMAPLAPSRWMTAFGACLASGLWAVIAWLQSPQGWLQWDGGAWRFQSLGPAKLQDTNQNIGVPTVHLDFQWVILVRFQSVGHLLGGARWLWLQHSHDAMQWMPLRRALAAPAVPDNAAAQPEPASSPRQAA